LASSEIDSQDKYSSIYTKDKKLKIGKSEIKESPLALECCLASSTKQYFCAAPFFFFFFKIMSAPCPTKMNGDDDAHTHFATMSCYAQGFFFFFKIF
jgi:hypothetical protein